MQKCAVIGIFLSLISLNSVAQALIFKGAKVRGDTTRQSIALVFTGHEYADGGKAVRETLKGGAIPASFFLTGDFYRSFPGLVKTLKKDGHYLGAHSDKHLLYCAWENRDSLLLTREEFVSDVKNNYRIMRKVGIRKKHARYFLPPYEWYNEQIAEWTKAEGLQLINFTGGTLSHADYTTPSMTNYRSSEQILTSIRRYEEEKGMNGFILLLHIGTHPERTDKLYYQLSDLIGALQQKGYSFVRVDDLLTQF